MIIVTSLIPFIAECSQLTIIIYFDLFRRNEQKEKSSIFLVTWRGLASQKDYKQLLRDIRIRTEAWIIDLLED